MTLDGHEDWVRTVSQISSIPCKKTWILKKNLQKFHGSFLVPCGFFRFRQFHGKYILSHDDLYFFRTANFSPDGMLIASASYDGTARRFLCSTNDEFYKKSTKPNEEKKNNTQQ